MTDRDILYYALELALREGVSQAKVVWLQNHEQKISVRDGRIDQMAQSLAQSLSFTLYVDGREGFFYTNNLSTETLPAFVRQAVQTTRLLSPDESRHLPDPARYYRGGGVDLQNCDDTLEAIDPFEKLQLARLANQQLLGADKRIVSLDTRYEDRLHRARFLTSNGLDVGEQSSRVTLSTILTLADADGRHPMDGWGNTRIRFRELPWEDIGPVALQRTLQKLGQRPAATGRYTMLVESPVAFSLLQPVILAMAGQALYQRSSFMLDMLDKPFGSPLMNIEDNPHVPNTRGACHFDYDGVATQPRQLFLDGRLQTYFIDTRYGQKLGMAPTTQGLHHLIFRPGQQSLQQMMAGVESGILVTDFNGGNCDPVTGQFSYGIEGLLIEHGVVVQAVSGMNITGQMQQLWQSLSAVGNDADPWETELVPTLRFEDVAFSGV